MEYNYDGTQRLGEHRDAGISIAISMMVFEQAEKQVTFGGKFVTMMVQKAHVVNMLTMMVQKAHVVYILTMMVQKAHVVYILTMMV